MLYFWIPLIAYAKVLDKKCTEDAGYYYDLARSAYNINNQFNQAIIRNLENAAKLGSNKAEYKLGIIYSEKKSNYYNYKESRKFLSKQVSKGNYNAAYFLAQLIYEKGWLDEKDYKDIEKYLKLAIKDDKNIEAYRDLSMIFFYAPDAFKDLKKAYNYSLEASKKDIPEAQFILGSFYNEGFKPISQDYKEAFYWYSLAAAKEYPKAINSLGLLYAKGQGIKKNEEEAIRLFEEACRLGSTSAMLNLGEVYLKGVLGVKQDIPKAKKYFNEALAKGNIEAKRYLKQIDD